MRARQLMLLRRFASELKPLARSRFFSSDGGHDFSKAIVELNQVSFCKFCYLCSFLMLYLMFRMPVMFPKSLQSSSSNYVALILLLLWKRSMEIIDRTYVIV